VETGISNTGLKHTRPRPYSDIDPPFQRLAILMAIMPEILTSAAVHCITCNTPCLFYKLALLIRRRASGQRWGWTSNKGIWSEI